MRGTYHQSGRREKTWYMLFVVRCVSYKKSVGFLEFSCISTFYRVLWKSSLGTNYLTNRNHTTNILPWISHCEVEKRIKAPLLPSKIIKALTVWTHLCMAHYTVKKKGAISHIPHSTTDLHSVNLVIQLIPTERVRSDRVNVLFTKHYTSF